MTIDCPKCGSPVASDEQRFCYRCGSDLNADFESTNAAGDPAAPAALPERESGEGSPATPNAPESAVETSTADQSVELAVELAVKPAVESPVESPEAAGPDVQAEQTATLRILLSSGDVFDREITRTEVQLGKGPRNDIVIADPAVSTSHAVIAWVPAGFTIRDIGSRNGTFINGERVSESSLLKHGDVIGLGLSKITFRLGQHSETREIVLSAGPLLPKQPPPLTEDSLAAAIVAARLVPASRVEKLRRAGPDAPRLYRALLDDRAATEASLRDLIGRTFQIETIDLGSAVVDEELVSRCSAQLLRETQVFPLAVDEQPSSKEGARRVVVAVADPTDAAAIEKVTRCLNATAVLRLSTASQISEQIERRFCAKLVVALPTGEKLEYPITLTEIEIGKASHNHIVLSDPTVSNTHAVVLVRDGGFSIVDLGSRNGTIVDGEPLGVQGRTLRHGDAIQLGQTVLTFRNPGETAASLTAVLSHNAAEEVRKRTASRTIAGGSPPAPEPTVVVEQVSDIAAPSSIERSAEESAAAIVSDIETAAASDQSAEDEKGEKKKKKKDGKKKGSDQRMKAAYISGLSRIVAQVLGVILAVLLALYVNHKMSSSPSVDVNSKGRVKPKLEKPGAGISFAGEAFEASGAAQMPGASAVLFVDDNRPGEVLWMNLDQSGQQVGDVKSIHLGVDVYDPEGITFDDPYFYIVGSQSDPKAGERNALVRFSLDPADQSITKLDLLTGLRDFLLENVPQLREDGAKKGEEGGLNIEGIALDPDPANRRLLLGLRSPLANGQALVVPIRLRDPHGSFSTDNLQIAGPAAIELSLDGLGIRDLQYDSRLKSFLVIAGATEHHEKTGFKLFEWDGAESKPREAMTLDSKMKPEGITRASIGGRDFIFIVGDAGSYLKLDYSSTE